MSATAPGARVRVGVIGAGAWAGACHLPALASRPEAEVVIVCDPNGMRAASAASKHGVARTTNSWEAVFDHPLDACVIASPAAAHYEQARAALQHGLHVLVEKPMVLHTEQAADLVALARAVGRELIVSFGWNYSAMFHAAQRLFADPGVGQLEHVSVHMASATRDLLVGASLSSTGSPDDRAIGSTWTDPAQSGGGYGQAQLTHAFGVLLGITDDDVVAASGYAGGPLDAPVETCIAAGGRLACGASLAISGASFHAGLAENRHQLEIRLFGSAGNLLIDFGRDELWVERAEGTRRADLPSGAGRYRGDGPTHALIDAALSGCGSANASNGELGMRVVRAIEHLYADLAPAETAASADRQPSRVRHTRIPPEQPEEIEQ